MTEMITGETKVESEDSKYRPMNAEDVDRMFNSIEICIKSVMKNGLFTEKATYSCEPRTEADDIEQIKREAEYIKGFLNQYWSVFAGGYNPIKTARQITKSKSVRRDHYIRLYNQLCIDLWYAYENSKMDFKVTYVAKEGKEFRMLQD